MLEVPNFSLSAKDPLTSPKQQRTAQYVTEYVVDPAAQAEFEASHTKVADGWISNADWAALSEADKQILLTQGIEYFNTVIVPQREAEQQQFLAGHVQLASGEWLTLEQWSAVPDSIRSKLYLMGVEAYNAWIQALQVEVMQDTGVIWLYDPTNPKSAGSAAGWLFYDPNDPTSTMTAQEAQDYQAVASTRVWSSQGATGEGAPVSGSAVPAPVPVMVTVPGVMGQMSEQTAKAAGYTDYIPVATSVITAPEGSIEWYQQQGIPLTPGGVLSQEQVQLKEAMAIPQREQPEAGATLSQNYSNYITASGQFNTALLISDLAFKKINNSEMQDPDFDAITSELATAGYVFSIDDVQSIKDAYAYALEHGSLSILSGGIDIPVVSEPIGQETATYQQYIDALKTSKTSMASRLGEAYIGAGIWAAESLLPIYGTQKYWSTMPTWGKILSVAGDVLFIAPVLKGAAGMIRFGEKATISTAKGEITVWQGTTIRGRPIWGMSGGETVIGRGGIKYPKDLFTAAKAGYEPVSKLENSVFGTKQALKKMGASENEINRAMVTLGERGRFAGKVSPFLEKSAPLPTVERLTQDEVGTIFQAVKEYGNKIEKTFGTVSLEPQLETKFKMWRPKHDIDIQTAMSKEDTNLFTQDVLERLQSKGSSIEYKIDPRTPGAVEKKIDGEWKKVTDIHSADEIVSGAEEISPTSREGSYGMLHYEKPIQVEYPGIGKIDIMTASEMGKRKAQSILRWQNGKFAPYDYRVKDITDFYVIDYTFRGKEAANAWAKAYGFDPAELLKLGQENPPIVIAWELMPETGKASGALPSMTLHVPESVRALVPLLSGYSLPESIRVSSSALSEIGTRLSSVSAKAAPLSPKIASIASVPISSLPSSILSMGISDKYAIPVEYASQIPYEYVAKQEYPGKYIPVDYIPPGYKMLQEIPTEYVPIKYIPSSYTPEKYIPDGYVPVKYVPNKYIVPKYIPLSPALVPPVIPEKPLKTSPPILLPGTDSESIKDKISPYEGAIGWQQGELRSGKVWYVYKKPWQQTDLEIIVSDNPPEGMKLYPSATKAIETMKVLSGEFPGERDVDIGAFQLRITGTKQLKGKYRRKGVGGQTADVSAKDARVIVLST